MGFGCPWKPSLGQDCEVWAGEECKALSLSLMSRRTSTSFLSTNDLDKLVQNDVTAAGSVVQNESVCSLT